MSTEPEVVAKQWCEEQKGPGKVYFVPDASAGHSGKGALEFDTRHPDGQARLSHRENDLLVRQVQTLAYKTLVRQIGTNNPNHAPALVLTLTAPPDVAVPTGPPSTSSPSPSPGVFVTLIWEPLSSGAVIQQGGAWQSWRPSEARSGWRTTRPYGNFTTAGDKSFADVQTTFGTSAVNTIGITQGSANPGLLARADDLQVNGNLYDFEVPAISTSATPQALAGQPISDTATVTGIYTDPSPTAEASTATVTFRLYSPADPRCQATPVFTSTKPAPRSGTVQSDPYVPVEVGDYHWIATYSGDENNTAVTGLCGEEGETSRVSSRPVLTTRASPPVVVGQQISDTATLTGVFTSPSATSTGTLRFDVYGPADPSCSQAPYATSMPVTTRGNGVYNSGAFTTTSPGTYRFIARYSGDEFNAPASGACNDPNESTVASKSTATLSTQATPTAPIGQPIADTATVGNVYTQPGATSTGTITFKLYEPPAPPSGGGEPDGPAPEQLCETIPSEAPPQVGGVISQTICTRTPTPPAAAPCSGTPVLTAVVLIRGDGSYRSPDYVPTKLGTYNWVASYSGDDNNTGASGACGDPGEQTVVTKTSPNLTTQATPTAPVGTAISDTATVGRLYAPQGSQPGGTLRFDVYGPADPTCAGPPVGTSSRSVTGNGTYTSDPYTATAAGTYRWIARYSGDEFNSAASGRCGEAGENSEVSPRQAAVVTQATPQATVGGAISDTATVPMAYAAPGATPTGTITFALYGPADESCMSTPVFTSGPKTRNGDGTYTSGPYTATEAGTYRWIATYSGDANNAPDSGECGEEGETSQVTPSETEVTTSATPTAPVGEQISDTATVTRTYQSPSATSTGMIRFELYAPGDPTCEESPIFVSGPKPVTGDGTYVSDPYTTTMAGEHRWIAVFEGDNNNYGAAGVCGEEGETSTVTKRQPGITTRATPTAPAGQAISDTATVTGRFGSPSGDTVTFRLYGPSDSTCASSPVFTSTAAVSEDGTARSAGFSGTSAGTYRWIATYNGDDNNSVAAGRCNDPDEQTVVTATPGGGGGGGGGGGTPVESTSPTPSTSASTSASPSRSTSASPTPTVTATTTVTATSSASATGIPCSSTLGVRINTTFINATGFASVTAVGAAPGSRVLLEGYSQIHEGTATFPNAGTVVRTGVADENGTVSWNDLRPSSNTRVRALQENCPMPVKDSVQERGGVINVRTTLFLTVERTGPRTYRFSGDSIPAREGGLIVSFYRITGRSCAAGVQPSACPGEQFLSQTRADEINGEYSITFTLGRTFAPREKFVLKTGKDAQNAPGRSNVRDLAIF